MTLTICLACGHPFTEHEASGCNDILNWSDDGYPDVCPCAKTADEVLRQHGPVTEQHPGERGAGLELTVEGVEGQ